jgi:hypothetical protein
MLPEPTTGGSKTRNIGFGTPQALLANPKLPPNWRVTEAVIPLQERDHGLCGCLFVVNKVAECPSGTCSCSFIIS